MTMVLEATRPIEDFTRAIRDAKHAQAGELFCQLLSDGVPLRELIHAAVAVEAPYVQVPSHIIEREAELVGVQYDHTSLALRAGLRVQDYMPPGYELLPWAQAVWYMPQGIDICGQLIGTFPGHYARQKGYQLEIDQATDPEVYFADVYEPVRAGTLEERLRAMFKFTVDGDRVRAWQYFLGLAEDATADPSLRPILRHETLFAALIDKEECFVGQSLTSQQGHKALRTRAMFDLADWLGWETALVVFYAGFPDLPTAPRFHTLYDFACGTLKREFGADAATLHERNRTPLSGDEVDGLIAIIHEGGKLPIAGEVTRLLREGRAIQSIADAIFLAGTEYMLKLEAPKAYFLPYHAYDYCNVATSWLRAGQDARSARVLYVMAQTVWAAIEAGGRLRDGRLRLRAAALPRLEVRLRDADRVPAAAGRRPGHPALQPLPPDRLARHPLAADRAGRLREHVRHLPVPAVLHDAAAGAGRRGPYRRRQPLPDLLEDRPAARAAGHGRPDDLHLPGQLEQRPDAGLLRHLAAQPDAAGRAAGLQPAVRRPVLAADGRLDDRARAGPAGEHPSPITQHP
jgi:hypothetical protein